MDIARVEVRYQQLGRGRDIASALSKLGAGIQAKVAEALSRSFTSAECTPEQVEVRYIEGSPYDSNTPVIAIDVTWHDLDCTEGRCRATCDTLSGYFCGLIDVGTSYVTVRTSTNGHQFTWAHNPPG